jgi:pyruvate dehydrogenase E2 component (dihydrolipoamide acetyltransferase)
MSVSVSMPQLGESVTEGTVTRWLKKEGERVEADEPLLEVSTDKVDTEIPSPVSGILRGITVAEDETVEVGAELAVIDEDGAAGGTDAAATGTDASGAEAAGADTAGAEAAGAEVAGAAQDGASADAQDGQGSPAAAGYGSPPAEVSPADGDQADQQAAATQGQDAPASQQPQYPSAQQPYPAAQPPYASAQPPYEQAAYPPAAPGQQPSYQQPSYQQPASTAAGHQEPAPQAPPPAPPQQAPPQAAVQAAPEQAAPEQAAPEQAAPEQAAPERAPAGQAPVGQQPASADAGELAGEAGISPLTSGTDGPYVTPLVRKLATEHGIDLGSVAGTGVGGRIRKQDVIDAARALRGPAAGQPGQAQAPPAAAPAAAATPAPATPAPATPQAASPQAATPAWGGQAAAASAAPRAPQRQESDHAPASRRAIVPSSLRGTTEQMSRARQLIAARMVESLQTSAQLTTVVEADVTAIARLRDRAKADFEAREGVKLSFLPFFALAAVEALKVHPRLNAVIDTASAQVTYHDAEHLGIAVDTDRGLMVPVIRKAGDLNIAGLARKIADLAERTRAGRVNPDDLSGGTFTLTNTGSRGALFDTPIINQPQVAILGTGTVVKRPIVVEDAALGEVITVRSMVYLALTYDHRLVDGADAARFLVTMKSRLEEGAFETELGL